MTLGLRDEAYISNYQKKYLKANFTGFNDIVAHTTLAQKNNELVILLDELSLDLESFNQSSDCFSATKINRE
ncbi:unnamed protein product [Acanthoscelides obtectus]|uniref:Uncharacterized protein n=1 Tax=Acanthoscelides obtectus TaxID=200917 RepID=A0A9P0PH05_ACAOB|nr:unnamed protein product [Acanthoscelides obtectus]CAK1627751.1 hypothetical protein AOBTE_LOCUS4807 [Acanthoscelides obtectus]